MENEEHIVQHVEGICHDLRTPLSGIMGFAALIKKEATSPNIVAYAEKLVSATRALLDFQNQLLDALKRSTECSSSSLTSFSLPECIHRALDLLRPSALLKGLSLEAHLSGLPDRVLGDQYRLSRIFLELLNNGLKFTVRGGVVLRVVTSEWQGERFTLDISVKDSGIGIPMEQQSAVFERAYRLSPTENPPQEGSGLGLSMVKDYVMALSGKIEMKSKQGQGTELRCHIPMLAVPDLAMTDTQISTPSFPKDIQVLLLEDHPLTAELVTLLLRDLYCQVTVAADIRQASVHFHRQAYDLVLMDVELPDGNALTWVKKIRASYARMPIFVLTAHNDVQITLACIEAGVTAVYQKPLLRPQAIQILNDATNAKCDVLPITDR